MAAPPAERHPVPDHIPAELHEAFATVAGRAPSPHCPYRPGDLVRRHGYAGNQPGWGRTGFRGWVVATVGALLTAAARVLEASARLAEQHPALWDLSITGRRDLNRARAILADEPAAPPHGRQGAATAVGTGTETPDSGTGPQTGVQPFGLRDRIALELHAAGGPFTNTTPEDLADAVLAVVQPELDEANATAERLRALRQELAEERYAWQERGTRAEATVARMRRTNRMVNGAARDARERAERAEATVQRVRDELAAIEAEHHGQHRDYHDGAREAVARIRAVDRRQRDDEPVTCRNCIAAEQ